MFWLEERTLVYVTDIVVNVLKQNSLVIVIHWCQWEGFVTLLLSCLVSKGR
jgi:hypothetical protein